MPTGRAPGPGGARPRPWRVRRVWGVVAVIALSIGGGGLAAGQVLGRWIRAGLQERYPELTAIGAIHFRPPLGAEIRDIQIEEGIGGDAGRARAELPALRVAVRPLPLLHREVIIDEVGLVRPRVTIVRGQDGRVRLPPLVVPPAGAPPGGPTPERPSAAAPSPGVPAGVPAISILRAWVRDGHVEVRDHHVRPEGHLTRVEAIQAKVTTSRGAADAGRLSFSGRARVTAVTGTRPGQIQLDGWVDPATWDGEGEVALHSVDVAHVQPYLQQVVPLGITAGTLDVRVAATARDRVLEVRPQFELANVTFRTTPDQRVLLNVPGLIGGVVLKLPVATFEEYLREHGGVFRLAPPPLRARLDDPRILRSLGKDLLESTVEAFLATVTRRVVGTLIESGAQTGGGAPVETPGIEVIGDELGKALQRLLSQ